MSIDEVRNAKDRKEELEDLVQSGWNALEEYGVASDITNIIDDLIKHSIELDRLSRN